MWRVGNKYVVDSRQLRDSDDVVVDAPSVSVVSVRPGTEVEVSFTIDSREASGRRYGLGPQRPGQHAGLGIIIVFNTGCLAAFAMFTALSKIAIAPAIALVPVALAWGWMIFSIDRWLITSTHGIRGASRTLVFIPCLALAVLIAFTIAEPLTLHIFRNSLDTQVRTTRTTQQT